MSASRELIVILNGVSRKKKIFYKLILPGLQTRYDIKVWETKHRDHAIELAEQATQQEPLGIFAAGGDGTMNQVLNGVMKSNNKNTTIGIIPLGTGNDFSKLNSILPNAQSITQKIELGGKSTDVGLVNCFDSNGEATSRYFINVASLGMGPEVVRRLFKSNRVLGPTLMYAKASIETFLTHKPSPIEIKADNWNWSGKLRVLAIANGQSFGGGLYVAPGASPDDGILSTFVVGEISTIKFLQFLHQLKSNKKIQDPILHYNSCTSLTLTSPVESWIETEGELAGVLPAEIKVIPNGIKIFR